MKALCSMAALSLALLLSSCSLTRQTEGTESGERQAATDEKIVGNPFSTRSRRPKSDSAPEQKDKTLAKTTESPTAEATATEPAAPAESTPAVTAPTHTPTPAQQEAAHKLMAETPAGPEVPTHNAEVADDFLSAPATSTPGYYPSAGSLRMGSIAPGEEAASATDAPPPGANSVDLHGLRSPKLPKGLPMGIDGKLNRKN